MVFLGAQPPADAFEGSSGRRHNGGARDSSMMKDVAPPMPEWAAQLPAPFRGILWFMYFSCIRRNDSYTDQLRKIVIAFVPLLSIAGTGSWLAALRSVSEEASAANIVETVAVFTMAAAFFIAFGVYKCAPHWNAGIIDVLVVMNLGYNVAVAVSFVNALMWVSAIRVATVPMLLRSPRSALILPLCLAVYCVSAFNEARSVEAVCSFPNGTLTVPGAHVVDDASTRLSTHASQLLLFCVVFAIIEAQLREAWRQTQASKASIVLASDIARSLAKYDLLTAHEKVAEARGEGDASTALLDGFDAIIENLEVYRPHLPNWVLPREMTASEEEEAPTELLSRRNDDPLSPQAQAQPRRTRRKSKRGADAVSSRSSSGRRSSRTGSNRAGSEPQRDMGIAGAGAVDELPQGLQLVRPQLRRVAVAIVTFSFREPGGLGGSAPFAGSFRLTGSGNANLGAPPAAAPAVSNNSFTSDLSTAACLAPNAFVDRIFELAGALAAAVHCFVGDQVYLSWNAGSRAVQPEAKVARFFARLRQNPGHADVAIHGGAAFGRARVQLAGHARQRTLLIHPAFSEALDAAVTLARTHATFIVDGLVEDGANHVVRFLGAGAAPAAAAAPTASSVTGSAPDRTLGTPPTPPVVPADPPLVSSANSSLTDSPHTAHRNVQNVHVAADTGAASPASSGVPLFEVVGEMKEAVDEWLYVVNQQARSVTSSVHGDVGSSGGSRFASTLNADDLPWPMELMAAVNQAARLTAAGSFLDARRAVVGIDADSAAFPPASRAFIKRLQQGSFPRVR